QGARLRYLEADVAERELEGADRQGGARNALLHVARAAAVEQECRRTRRHLVARRRLVRAFVGPGAVRRRRAGRDLLCGSRRHAGAHSRPSPRAVARLGRDRRTVPGALSDQPVPGCCRARARDRAARLRALGSPAERGRGGPGPVVGDVAPDGPHADRSRRRGRREIAAAAALLDACDRARDPLVDVHDRQDAGGGGRLRAPRAGDAAPRPRDANGDRGGRRGRPDHGARVVREARLARRRHACRAAGRKRFAGARSAPPRRPPGGSRRAAARSFPNQRRRTARSIRSRTALRRPRPRAPRRHRHWRQRREGSFRRGRSRPPRRVPSSSSRGVRTGTMTARPGRLVALVVAVAWLDLSPHAARAAPAEPPHPARTAPPGAPPPAPRPAPAEPPLDDRQARAEARFQQGSTAFDEGRVDEACAAFLESLTLYETAGTLLNLALCHEAQGKTASAWREFTHAAASTTDPVQRNRRDFARQHAQKLEPGLERLLVDVSPQEGSVAIAIDGEAISDARRGLPLFVAPGAHAITASAPLHKGFVVAVNVPAGPASAPVVVHVPALDAEPLPASPLPEPEKAPPPPSHRTRRDVAWVLAGAGAVGVGLGAAFGVDALVTMGSCSGPCDPRP